MDRSPPISGGKRFFPHGVPADEDVLDEQRFDNGVVVLPYGVRHGA